MLVLCQSWKKKGGGPSKLRNNVQVVGVVIYDTGTGQPTGGAFVGTQDEADSLKADLEAIFTPPNFEVRETNYWVELNKNTTAQILTAGISNGVLNFAFLSTKPVLKSWNSENPAFITSKRVNGDETAIVKPKTSGSGGGTATISLLSYLLLLLNTWGGGTRLKSGQFEVQPKPQRWIEWLQLLIQHYNRYTPTQIYAFLARVDFTGPTFKV